MNQLVTDRENDVDMEDINKIDDYDFEEVDQDDLRNAISDIEEQERSEFASKHSYYDEDEEEKGGDPFLNRETLQAQMYDRTFTLHGPVIKVYKTADEDNDGPHQRLAHQMNFPKIKNEKGQTIQPTNMLLHNNESQLIFMNESDPSQVAIFDLEKGKIVQTLENTDRGPIEFR